MGSTEEYKIISLRRHEDIYCAIDGLKNDIYDQTYNNTEKLQELSKKYSLYANVLAIKKDGSIKGICVFYDNDSDTKTAFLSMIVISRLEQGQGYGHILLNEMSRICKEHGMIRICLEVANTNEKAIGFYEDIGYRLEHAGDSTSTYTISIM